MDLCFQKTNPKKPLFTLTFHSEARRQENAEVFQIFHVYFLFSAYLGLHSLESKGSLLVNEKSSGSLKIEHTDNEIKLTKSKLSPSPTSRCKVQVVKCTLKLVSCATIHWQSAQGSLETGWMLTSAKPSVHFLLYILLMKDSICKICFTTSQKQHPG